MRRNVRAGNHPVGSDVMSSEFVRIPTVFARPGNLAISSTPRRWSQTMPLIRDIMSKIVVSVRPGSTLMDAVKVLAKHHLSGAPVISTQGELVGFISEPNLMDVLFDHDARAAKVAEYMTREVQIGRAHA